MTGGGLAGAPLAGEPAAGEPELPASPPAPEELGELAFDAGFVAAGTAAGVGVLVTGSAGVGLDSPVDGGEELGTCVVPVEALARGEQQLHRAAGGGERVARARARRAAHQHSEAQEHEHEQRGDPWRGEG